MTKKEKEKIIRNLEYDIIYEEREGIHTYHLCPHCNKNSTRSGRCSECLREDIKRLKGEK